MRDRQRSRSIEATKEKNRLLASGSYGSEKYYRSIDS
jgi:hypothetical protein